MTTKIYELKEIYPVGKLEKGNFVDLFEVLPNKKWNLICTIITLSDKKQLDEEELKITKECIVWDEDKFPDIYIKEKITEKSVNYALNLLSKETKTKYKLINKNLAE